MLRHLAPLWEPRVRAGEVHLHDEVDVASGLVIGHGRVRPHHDLALPCRLEEHVLASGQPQPALRRGQSEAEDSRVVGHHDLVHEGQPLKFARVQKAIADPAGRFEHARRRPRRRRLERPDVVVPEHVPSLLRVHRLKVVGRLLASHDEDARRATRVVPQVVGAVVDLALHDDPRGLRVSVLFDLFHRHPVRVQQDRVYAGR
mmetsp:Transcript_91116/g.278933  ORF Transcript_91116/g.278933 Transcript_91116/m.278933 type:complete len:202 (+) Transcript_91116:873-1478(+)